MQFISLVIPILVILIASITKRLIPSLFIGLVAGGILLAKGNPLFGIVYSAEHVLSALQSTDNLLIILVLFLFGSLAEIIKVSGGIKGFVEFAGKKVKSEKGAYASVWILTLFTFIDCCFHTIAVGTITRPLFEKMNGNKRKLASVINITSCLLIILIPIGTTYAGYIVGTIAESVKTAGSLYSPYSLFIKSIPYNFFAITMTVLALVISFTKIGFRKTIPSGLNKKDLKESEHDSDEAHEQCAFEQKTPPRVFNLILPLFILIASIFYFLWFLGDGTNVSFIEILKNTDFEKSIFIAISLTIILISIYYKLQKMPLKEMEVHFLKGGNEMIPPITILILSWGLSSVVRDLGFADFISQFVKVGFPVFMLPFLIFVICCLASYFMGSAWGTWALVMPIAVSLAVNADISLPLIIGAVLSGGALGDNASPLGETAVLSAAVVDIPLIEHVKSQLPLSLIGVGISGLLFIIVSLLMP